MEREDIRAYEVEREGMIEELERDIGEERVIEKERVWMCGQKTSNHLKW
jgi:hypothetical protein